MKNEILNLFYQDDYKPLTYQQIKEQFPLISDEDFSRSFDELKNDGEIISKNGVYDRLERLGFVKGHITLKNSGFGYILDPSDNNDPIAISPNELNNSFPNDFVIVEVDNRNYDFKRNMRYGVVKKVIKHEKLYLVGTVKYLKKFDKYVLDIKDEKMRFIECILDKNSVKNILDEIVKVEVFKYLGRNKVIANVVEKLGHPTDPGIDILSVVCQNNIPHTFSDSVLEELDCIPDEVDPKDLENRRSQLNDLVITIDGDDAKDLDDAISISKNEDTYCLKVHIADVSHYVLEGSNLDKEALNRSTSVYLADRVIPMLPRKLSNGICSLNEGVIRLTMTCEMTFDSTGNLIDHDIYESYIKSAYRMTYTNVNKMINKDQEIIKKYAPLKEMVELMVELSDILRLRREMRGACDFDTSECKFKIDEFGNVLEIIPRARDKAEMLIEDFMLAANETVATHLTDMNLPCLYRIHEQPDAKKMDKAITVIRSLGGNIKGHKGSIHPKNLQNVLKAFVGKDEEKVVNTLLLRSMAKAKYSPHNVGHFGLALENYCHFTSPIRRYPDTITHRMLKDFFFRNKNFEKEVNKYHNMLDYIGYQTSKMERLAIDTEREVDDMKKAEYMQKHINEKFEGVISSITSFGMFVELENTVEGLVHVTELLDDYYEFNESLMCMVGRRKKKIYRMGDKVLIKVLRASKDDRQVDFAILRKL